MIHASLNYLAVLVAGLAYFALGAIWYARPVFGNLWMSGIGKTEEQLKAEFSAMKMVYALIGSLLVAYGMARILSWTMAATVTDALMAALVAGVCFVLTTFAVRDTMEGHPFKLTAINVLYNIIGFLLIGLILGVWK